MWAGAAWYWHRKKTHSELAKAIIIVMAVLIAIGEIVGIAKQFTSEPRQAAIGAKRLPPEIPEYAYTPPADNRLRQFIHDHRGGHEKDEQR